MVSKTAYVFEEVSIGWAHGNYNLDEGIKKPEFFTDWYNARDAVAL